MLGPLTDAEKIAIVDNHIFVDIRDFFPSEYPPNPETAAEEAARERRYAEICIDPVLLCYMMKLASDGGLADAEQSGSQNWFADDLTDSVLLSHLTPSVDATPEIRPVLNGAQFK